MKRTILTAQKRQIQELWREQKKATEILNAANQTDLYDEIDNAEAELQAINDNLDERYMEIVNNLLKLDDKALEKVQHLIDKANGHN